MFCGLVGAELVAAGKLLLAAISGVAAHCPAAAAAAPGNRRRVAGLLSPPPVHTALGESHMHMARTPEHACRAESSAWDC